MTTGMFFAPDRAEPSYPPRQLRVLVVDDNRDEVITLLFILRDEGYDAKGAYGGEEALAAISEFDPDVVITDIAMPDMTGWDLARQVRKSASNTRPVLIAVSGQYIKAADRVLAQMVGFNQYLAKPCSPSDVLALLKGLSVSK